MKFSALVVVMLIFSTSFEAQKTNIVTHQETECWKKKGPIAYQRKHPVQCQFA